MVKLEFYLPPDTRTETVRFPAGLVLPSDVVVTAYDHEGYDVQARVEYDGERYVCTELQVKRREGGPPVTSEAIRSVPVRHLVRHAVMHQRYEMAAWDRGEPVRYELAPEAKPPDVKRDGTEAMVRWVAQQYQLAAALNMPPTKSIQDQLGVSRATAGRWVAEARREGLLPVPDEGGE